MNKKPRRASKKRASRRASPKPSQAKMEGDLAATFEPKHVQKFVSDILTRGEAGRLKRGKLSLGKTHILGKRKGGPPKLTRARFNLTGSDL